MEHRDMEYRGNTLCMADMVDTVDTVDRLWGYAGKADHKWVLEVSVDPPILVRRETIPLARLAWGGAVPRLWIALPVLAALIPTT